MSAGPTTGSTAPWRGSPVSLSWPCRRRPGRPQRRGRAGPAEPRPASSPESRGRPGERPGDGRARAGHVPARPGGRPGPRRLLGPGVGEPRQPRSPGRARSVSSGRPRGPTAATWPWRWRRAATGPWWRPATRLVASSSTRRRRSSPSRSATTPPAAWSGSPGRPVPGRRGQPVDGAGADRIVDLPVRLYDLPGRRAVGPPARRLAVGRQRRVRDGLQRRRAPSSRPVSTGGAPRPPPGGATARPWSGTWPTRRCPCSRSRSPTWLSSP